MNKYSKYLNLWLLLVSMSLVTACETDDDAAGSQKVGITEFYNPTINKMIDANYELVKANGYAELVIPASLYPKDMIKLPETDVEAMEYVIKAGHTAYVNGGAVRDGVMGKELHDVDFSTDATADELVAIVPNSHKTQAGKVEIAQAEHEGGMRTDMVPYQAMDIRLKGQPGIPESEYFGQTYSKNLIDDSFGRDLTINSVYYDYKTGDIIDYHGGLHDIREKIIRTPYEPNLAFTIDPQSMLRAVRFAARYEFTIEENTAQAIENNLHKIEAVNPALRRFVVIKGFCDKCAFRTYQYNVRYGILGYLCPLLKDYIGNADYEEYLKTVFDYVDSQKAMEASLAYCILFMQPMMEAFGDQEPTLENITATFDQIEQESGQDQLFWLEDYYYTKKDPMHIWLNYLLMTDDKTLEDAALMNSIRKEYTFKSSLMLLNGMALYDSSLKKYADEWNKNQSASTDLDNMEADYTVKDGEVLTGISEFGLIVPDGATITLESAGTMKSIICQGDAKIILSKGTTNIINNSERYGSAILTKSDKTLTIDGEGKLCAFGGQEGAGIGGNGHVVIEDGTIEAYGGQYGAGIGSEFHSPCGDITINGGKIKAVGGDMAAGIGSGQEGECGKILIKSTVTEVVAIAGDECDNNIGAGADGSCGEVTIEDNSKILDE